MRDQHIHELAEIVKERTRLIVGEGSIMDLASMDWLQKVLLAVARAICVAVVEAWRDALFNVAREMLAECPGCGRRRKWKWRRTRTLKLSVVGLNFELPSPYVECLHCKAPAVNVVKLLTGLRSGDSSTELELLAGYGGGLETYRRASDDLRVHHGQEVERTKVRRMSLKVEADAVEYAEELRQEADEAELPPHGAACLIIEADGGSARTGKLVPCEEEDEGYGKKTAKRGMPKRKKVTQGREIITMDIRVPGEMEPRGQEAMVPAVSPPGERGRRMRTMAARSGRGQDTEMRGLGDMGSGLGRAFDGTFGKPHFWCADWKHVTDYFDAAGKVLVDFDTEQWKAQMEDMVWNRYKSMVDHLLCQAFGHLPCPLPEDLDKCPVHSLQTYLNNNWDSLRSKQMRAEGFPFISARAESQVRDRTRRRFGGPGTWLEENLEPKATLLAIVREGSWDRFANWVRYKRSSDFRRQMIDRCQEALRQGRITNEAMAAATAPPTAPELVSLQEEEDDHSQHAAAM